MCIPKKTPTFARNKQLFTRFTANNTPIKSMKRILFIALGLIIACGTLRSELKYVFYFIGDGMGPNEVLATEIYQAELDGKIGYIPLCMTQFPYGGLLRTYSASNGVTDSSAAGTALACGEKANNHTLGLNAKGDTLTSLAESLKAQGWAVGITTSVSIDHATPASFYANSNNRNDYYAVGLQLAESNFDFFGGSAFKHPQDRKKDKRSLYEITREKGYTLIRGYNDFLKKKDQAQKVILVNHNEALTEQQRGGGMLPYALDKSSQDLTLPQITRAAVDFLSATQKPFFLMTEGGAIDWAGHANDARTLIEEVREFDQSIQVAYEFYLQHPDETLIIVTADHETGGLIIGDGRYELNLKALQHQNVSVSVLSDKIAQLRKTRGADLTWEELRELLTQTLGFYNQVTLSEEEDTALQAIFARTMSGDEADVKTLYKTLGELADKAVRILNEKSVIGWTSGSHSATPVPIFSVGVGAERFAGWHDNTEVAPLIYRCLSDKK